jgi:hypothetical protein
MLYGAAYFTEDEWIKIDGLIHKGQYVFTRGPQSNILEEELMSFEDSIEEKAQVNMQIQANESLHTIKADNITITERQIPSPSSSEPAESTDYPAETPNGTSAEASSDDEATHTQVAEPAPMFDFSEMATSVSTEPAETPKLATTNLPTEGGLALGYTQAQLDEVKAFNAGLTKAGKKSRPKYTPIEESYPSPEWSEGEVAPSEQTNEEGAYPSPTPTEHETRIQSWASQVNTPEPNVPEIISPKPSKGGLSGPPAEAKVVLEAFVKTHGRKPKSINDVYQPNNPQFRPLDQRPASRASNTTSKTAKSISKAIIARPSPVTATKAANVPDPRLKPGKIFIAQRAFEKKSTINIEVRPGDNIKILKHVSGITHVGLNLNTQQTGQFPELIFTLPVGVTAKHDALIEQQRALAAAKQNSQVTLRNRVQSVSTVTGLDRVEGMNAAEWDDMSVVSKTKASAPTPAPVKKPLGGLSASRYAVLADEDTSVKKPQENLSGMSKEEVSRLVDEKVCSLPSSVSDNTDKEEFAQILAAQQATANANANSQITAPTGPRAKAPLKDPLTPVTPKTATCWFVNPSPILATTNNPRWWATPNKECRFTADECRDLHAFLPVPPSDPANLRMGKPTWGALADSLPTPPTPASADMVEYKFTKAAKTCWYWANDGKCQNTADSCKYLHEHCAAGVAPKPNSYKRINWSRWAPREKSGENSGDGENGNGSEGTGNENWDSNGWGEETGAEEGELVLEEVQGSDSWGVGGSAGWGNASSTVGWGESSEDKYKPPHIKALEQKAQIEAIGW